MATTETNVSQLKVNRLTKTQYEEQTTIGANELSLVNPEFTGSKALVTDSNGDIVESAVTSTEVGYLDGVTSNIQTQINSKQATISNLSTIESNASNGNTAYTTIQGYGNIVTHNTSEFATAEQGSKADSALQSITSSDVTTALGYTPMANTTKYGADLSYSNSQLQLKDQDGNALGTAVTIESSPSIDNTTITTNTSSQLQASSLVGLTSTVSELNYCDGVTSNIQTQIDNKATDSTVVHLAGAETVSGTKTFNYSALTSANLIINSGTRTTSAIRFDVNGTTKGYLGINPNGVPCHSVNGSTINNSIVRSTWNTTTGSATNPVYINSSGVATATNLKYGADLSYSNSQLQLKDQDGNALGNAVTIESSPAIDNTTITTNTSSQLQAVGIIDSSDSTTAIKTWTGTKAEYDAIETKDNATLYNITDDTDISLTLLQTIYPVGSIYITTASTCPLASLFGTWQLVAGDRVIQGAGTRGSAGTTVDESLPNITGSATDLFTGSGTTGTGAITMTKGSTAPQTGGSSYLTTLTINASNSSSTYQDNAPVQQDAYIVNIYERTA